jgi:hypothetical protein
MTWTEGMTWIEGIHISDVQQATEEYGYLVQVIQKMSPAQIIW